MAPVDDFRSTSYIAIYSGEEFAARIGECREAVDCLLRELGATSGVFITGWNPLSVPQLPAVNAATNTCMATVFAERGVRTLPHIGRSDDGLWSEEGFFALNLPLADALAVASEFDQHAVVLVELGHPAELHLTGP